MLHLPERMSFAAGAVGAARPARRSWTSSGAPLCLTGLTRGGSELLHLRPWRRRDEPVRISLETHRAGPPRIRRCIRRLRPAAPLREAHGAWAAVGTSRAGDERADLLNARASLDRRHARAPRCTASARRETVGRRTCCARISTCRHAEARRCHANTSGTHFAGRTTERDSSRVDTATCAIGAANRGAGDSGADPADVPAALFAGVKARGVSRPAAKRGLPAKHRAR